MASDMSSNEHAREELVPGSLLTSRFSNYKVLTILGDGAFGKATKSVRMADTKTVAIKVMENNGFDKTTKNEMSVQQKNSHKHNMVDWHRAFVDRGNACLEFECLDKSLFDFMRERHFQPLSLKAIRPIVMQIALALQHLKSIGIIHADLKLENIMLVNHQEELYKIKVIDFGLTCDTSAARVGSCIQTSPYQSPEITLGLPVTEAIDIWSLGITAAYLYLGSLLYPGDSEYDMMRYIVETQGKPPDTMLNSGQKTSHFFCASTGSNWNLKKPEQVFTDSGICFTERRRWKFTSLNDLLHVREPEQQIYADKAAEMCDHLMFVEMVKEMLQLDPETRITPQQVLDHPFSKISHMEHLYHLSSYVKSCYQLAEICNQTSTVSSDSHTVVSGFLQQPVSETGQPAQQRLPPPAAEGKIFESPPSSSATQPPSTQRSRPYYFRSRSCVTAQTVSVKPTSKRKYHKEDINDTSWPVKRKTNCKDVGEKILPSSKYKRSDHAHKKFQYSPEPSCSTNCTQSSISENKRKMDCGKTASHSRHKRARKGQEHSQCPP